MNVKVEEVQEKVDRLMEIDMFRKQPKYSHVHFRPRTCIPYTY